MDFTHCRPPAHQQPPPPPHPAVAHPYNPYTLPPLQHPPPTHFPNPYAPHGGFAAGYAPCASANVGVVSGLAASYYGRIGPDPVGYGQIPPRAFAPPQKGSKYNNKKGSKPTKAVQSAYCGACKVECTTQEVLKAHKQGKKHKKQLHKLQESITPKPPVEKKEEKKRKDAPSEEEDLETKKRKLLEGGAQPDEVKVCTICNIVVNSQKVFDSHIAGSKHAEKAGRRILKMQRNLELMLT